MIYHIATRNDWEQALSNQIYFCDSLETEGFIHCSTGQQVVNTANRYFANRTDLCLLLISEAEVSSPLKYESPSYATNEKFPHIYSPLEMDAIKQVIPFLPNEDGSFAFPEEKIVQRWWLEQPLSDFTEAEWESLCDGCARCCLYKLQDIDTEELFYTDVACKFLDLEKCICTDYPNRHTIMPTCIHLTPDNVHTINWMPRTCAYRKLAEGKDLSWWHPLNTGDSKSVQDAGISIDHFAILETQENMDHLEDHVQEWLNFE